MSEDIKRYTMEEIDKMKSESDLKKRREKASRLLTQTL